MARASNSTLMQRWAGLSLMVRSLIAVLALIALVMSAVYAVGGVSDDRQMPQVGREKASSSNLRLGTTSGADGGEKIAGKMDAAQNQIQELKKTIDQQKAEQQKTQAAFLAEFEKLRASGQMGPGQGVNADLIETVRRLSEEVRDLKASPKAAGPVPSLDAPLPGASGGLDAAAPAPKRPALQSFGGKVAEIVVKEEPRGKDGRILKTGREALAYLPAGSMFEAVLMNGAYAPTNSVARRNPVPMLLRVKSEAVLPNRHSQDIRECFLIISGYGELASERLLARTEVLSCTLADGRVAEAKIDGYIVGEDGKLGMQGVLVSRQGQRIAQALVAGGLAGVAKGLQPYQVPQLNLGSTGGTGVGASASTGLDQVLQSGAAGGLADTAKMISQFYLDTAKEMYPVVSIDSLRKATIILTKGFELRG